MKILLDENLPDTLVDFLSRQGHEVDSVNRLELKGINNGALYTEIAVDYDLFFTKDAGFAHNVRQMNKPGDVRLIHVTIPQEEAKKFSMKFTNYFLQTDWDQFKNGDRWPEKFIP